jgi:hypothetical protein
VLPWLAGYPPPDYSNGATKEAMLTELKVSEQCDGVRCDMAMLVLTHVFERTWGGRAPPFWLQRKRRAMSANSGRRTRPL